MRLSALSLIGITSLLAAAEPASARDGCGRGNYFNGSACVQQPYYEPQPQYYEPRVQIYQQPYGYGGGYRQYGRQPYVGHGGNCPNGYTVQHGRCEPYRGR
jgi:hypothetical protein